ncbi:hypothetical protein N825_32650 [Skermanella stibiiresistens SB22]|uniref:Uncharacterized protein n=1 Tax=Skermanella stibiiresistens SB22 TaxID=1385369 RepID=W9GTU9_9PROT|nr:hypothetical protein N825_32650 [Skermanella stibiiresistens SB22]
MWPGSRRDAVPHAVGANARHGLPRSNADKRDAVMILLKDPEWLGGEIALRTFFHSDRTKRRLTAWSGRAFIGHCHVNLYRTCEDVEGP